MRPHILTVRNGDVEILSFNNPTRLNALTPALIEALADALDQAAARARAVILRGEGRSFCAGFDIGSGLDLSSPAFDAGAVLETHVNPLLQKMQELPVPIITAVRGAAAGAGAALALAGDIVVASADAYLLQAFKHVGLVPDAGASWMLSRTVGKARAMELVLLGEKLAAETALQWGLINRIVPGERLDDAALEIAQRLASGPKPGLALTRRMIWKAFENGFVEQLALERESQREAGISTDFREGVSAFQSGRRPRFGQIAQGQDS